MTQARKRRERLQSRAAHDPIIAGIGPAGGNRVLRLTQAIAARHSTDTLVVSVVTPPPSYSMDFSQPLLTSWPIEERRAERRQSVHTRLDELGAWFPWREKPDVAIEYGAVSTSLVDVADDRHASLMWWAPDPVSMASCSPPRRPLPRCAGRTARC